MKKGDSIWVLDSGIKQMTLSSGKIATVFDKACVMEMHFIRMVKDAPGHIVARYPLSGINEVFPSNRCFDSLEKAITAMELVEDAEVLVLRTVFH